MDRSGPDVQAREGEDVAEWCVCDVQRVRLCGTMLACRGHLAGETLLLSPLRAAHCPLLRHRHRFFTEWLQLNVERN